MSNSHLIEWIDQLLFGNTDPRPPPPEMINLILRMESEHIPWLHSILEGGLTAFPYQVHGDLNSLLDYLEKQWIDQQPYFDPPSLKTRAVSKFWDQLQLLLARKLESQPPLLPVPSKRDDEILKEILEPTQHEQSFDYESAKFWGQIARKFIHLSRLENVPPLPNAPSDLLKRASLLYEITCNARGRYFDPLCMYLVPRSEYVNAVHWQSSLNLEAFMDSQPNHPLTFSVRNLLKKCLNSLLHGKKSSAVRDSCPQVDDLLHNVKVIHETIQQVPHGSQPPKLIDVFRGFWLCVKETDYGKTRFLKSKLSQFPVVFYT